MKLVSQVDVTMHASPCMHYTGVQKFISFFSLRALARIGTAYYKQEKLEPAVKYFNKSLAEHRNPDIVKKKLEVRRRVWFSCAMKCGYHKGQSACTLSS